MKKLLISGLVLGFWFSGAASAAFVAPDSATVLAGGTLSGYDVNDTINGSGLDVHNETGVMNYPSLTQSYFSQPGTSATVNYGFNSAIDVGAFYLWNGGSNTYNGYGIKDFTLEFFSGATSLGSTGTLTASALPNNQPSYAAEVFSGFLFSNVTDIQLQVANTYGTSYVSVNEVGFDTSPVPVPAAVWLFGSGLIALLGLKRKNKALITA
ncbi:VPLPA-CTERM sorting domain-containing protein [Pseudomonadota bacterium]